MDIKIGDRYWVKENKADDWLGEVVKVVENSRTKFIMKDVTPDGPRIWHQQPGGGAYVTTFSNGFFGEEVNVHKKKFYRK
jgi:hypothetical protein